jgi:hypothetical protein
MPRAGSFVRVALFAASLLSLDIGGRVARADDTDACLAAYEKSQQLRKDGQFAASREQLTLCVQPKCHNLIKRDCSRWMSELERVEPTVIVKARDAQGKDVLSVRVSVDGAVFQDRLDGKPHEVDPGVHVFRYEKDGAPLGEERVVIQEGEKNRVVNVRIEPAEAVVSRPAAKPAEARPPAPVGGYVLLGAGAAGVTAFAVLAAMGKHDLDEMRKEGGCAPNCAESQVDAARTKIIAANVSLGIGVVAAAVGTLWLLKPRRANVGLELGVRPVAGGAATDLAYRF